MQRSVLIASLPNLITLGRLLSVPVAVWLILNQHFSICFWLFLIAGISDAVDGFIAKRFRAKSELGAYLDPLADKALLVSVFIALGHEGVVEGWLVILIVFRDLLIIGGALLYFTMTGALRMQPLWISKLNTALQILLAAALLAKAGLGIGDGLTQTLVHVVAATTLLSGAAYVAKWGFKAARIGESAAPGE
ncbi:MAG TPA: CDP-alcohol phosphatidyltransferase family protein [Alphaproteobacteria bacterium]|nr:CDP-alcohol phosphatidyltransferase family protein [Alphaproteobacteria bacterium]